MLTYLEILKIQRMPEVPEGTAKVDFENIVFPVHVPMVCIDSDLQLYGDRRKAVKKLTRSKDPSSPSYLEIFI